MLPVKSGLQGSRQNNLFPQVKRMDIKEKLENMKPFHMWLLFMLLYVSFSTEVLWRPFIFAEDTLFLNNALTDGFKSLFYRHAEYWEMISRLSGNLAIFLGRGANSYLVTAFVMKAIAIAIFSYYILYFAIADFSWLVKERWKRLLISFFVLVWFGNFLNSYYNVTNIHWAGEYFLFLVGLNLVFNNKFPGIFCTVICLLTCMNSPEACLVLIPFAIYILNRIRERKIKLWWMLVYILVFFATVLQFYVVKKSGNGANVTDVSHIFSALSKSFVALLSTASYVLGNEIRSYLNPGLRVISGCFIWFFIISLYIKIGKVKWSLILLYVLVFIFLHYMPIYIKYSFVWPQDFWVHSCPASVLSFLFLCAIANLKRITNNNVVKQTILLFSLIVIVSQLSHAGKIDGLGPAHYKTYDYEMLGMSQIEEANKIIDFNSRNYKTLRLYAGWDLLIPVKSE